MYSLLFFRMHQRSVRYGLLTLFCFLQTITFATWAASLQIYPVVLGLSSQERARAIYVKNVGEESIRAQLRVFGWRQLGGAEQLIHTNDVVASPPITTIPPGKQQLIRIIMPSPMETPYEQSYRLIVDELPGGKKTDGVSFLLRYVVPVFINSPKGDGNFDIKKIKIRIDNHHELASMIIDNASDQHIKLSNVYLQSGSRKYVLSKGLLGYVLAHSQMSWPLPEGIRSGNLLTFILNNDDATTMVSLVGD